VAPVEEGALCVAGGRWGRLQHVPLALALAFAFWVAATTDELNVCLLL
jgi:hypothetical protein